MQKTKLASEITSNWLDRCHCSHQASTKQAQEATVIVIKPIIEKLTCEFGIWMRQSFNGTAVYLSIARCDTPIRHDYSYNTSACWAVHIEDACGVQLHIWLVPCYQ